MSIARSAHPRVAAWLGNFSETRRDTALLLIDALRLVGANDLRRELGGLVAELVQSLLNPVAAFPVRTVGDGKAAHGGGRDGDYPFLEPGTPGSEAVVANIVTGVFRTPASRGRLLDPLDLPVLRDKRARTILLVDDFSGSGDRIIDFDKALRRHPTFRSWASGGFLDLHVAVHTATARAYARLRRRFGKDRVHVIHACPTFAHAGWSPEQLAEVEKLCVSHVARGYRKRALGYGDSRALVAFEHSAPNNLPQILWRTGGDWRSLFEGKAVPGDLLRLYSMSPEPPHEPIIGSAGARRLGDIIDLLGHRVRNPHTLAETTGISVPEVQRLLLLTRDLGLIGAKARLTDRGLALLRERRAAKPERELPNRTESYYPHALRAER